MSSAWRWRPMVKADLDGVVDVARTAFPDHFEDRACFSERLELYPQGCFVLEQDGRRIAGYLIIYPWLASSAPPLNTLIGALPASPQLLYLHDLAIHPSARGLGLTHAIINQIAEQAKGEGWEKIALVAVNEAAAFWGKQGFVVSDDPAMTKKLASYGDDARYMMRQL